MLTIGQAAVPHAGNFVNRGLSIVQLFRKFMVVGKWRNVERSEAVIFFIILFVLFLFLHDRRERGPNDLVKLLAQRLFHGPAHAVVALLSVVRPALPAVSLPESLPEHITQFKQRLFRCRARVLDVA